MDRRKLEDRLAELLPPLYSTESQKEKVAPVKFFGGGRWTWYAVEGERMCTECGAFEKDHEGSIIEVGVPCKAPKWDWLFFGYVVSGLGPDCDEWGNFSLDELASVRFKPLGLPVERDLYWKPGPIPFSYHERG